jgi:NADPH-dependent 2,4-dienoyl-CoA reductase/sulfur reductase-like enzyme
LANQNLGVTYCESYNPTVHKTATNATLTKALLFIAFAVGNNNNRMSENNTIIVVGGGISGLALALGLANDGFQVQVVEKDVMKRTGSAFCLQPNGLKALQEIHEGPWTFLDKGILYPCRVG